MKIFEWLEGLIDRITRMVVDTVEEWLDRITTWSNTVLSAKIMDETALNSIDENLFSTPEIKERVRKLKEEWREHNTTGSDIINSLIAVVMGQYAKLQFNAITGMEDGQHSDVMNGVWSQIGIITDIQVIITSISTAAEIMSIGQVDKICDSMSRILDVSGLTQITGFGYGMMLSNAISPCIMQDVNEVKRPTLLQPGELISAEWRGIEVENGYDKQLARHGFKAGDITALKAVHRFYPPAIDFIRFAVRDVFNARIVEQYGYDEGWEVTSMGLKDKVAKTGMDLDVLQWYWRAHWELPSVKQGYQMLHRDIIKQDELEELLKISDIAPAWIPKLIEAAYQPITRVDLRRLYNEGVIPEEGLIKGYKDLGYSSENAELMSDWTVKQHSEKEREITKTEILRAYTTGEIGLESCKAMLTKMGYSDEDVQYIIAYEDFKMLQAEQKEIMNTGLAQLETGVISLADFEVLARAQQFSEGEKLRWIIKGQRLRQKGVKSPSKDDLKRWIEAGIITRELYKERLIQIGYTPQDVELYAKEV